MFMQIMKLYNSLDAIFVTSNIYARIEVKKRITFFFLSLSSYYTY